MYPLRPSQEHAALCAPFVPLRRGTKGSPLRARIGYEHGPLGGSTTCIWRACQLFLFPKLYLFVLLQRILQPEGAVQPGRLGRVSPWRTWLDRRGSGVPAQVWGSKLDRQEPRSPCSALNCERRFRRRSSRCRRQAPALKHLHCHCQFAASAAGTPHSSEPTQLQVEEELSCSPPSQNHATSQPATHADDAAASTASSAAARAAGNERQPSHSPAPGQPQLQVVHARSPPGAPRRHPRPLPPPPEVPEEVLAALRPPPTTGGGRNGAADHAALRRAQAWMADILASNGGAGGGGS